MYQIFTFLYSLIILLFYTEVIQNSKKNPLWETNLIEETRSFETLLKCPIEVGFLNDDEEKLASLAWIVQYGIHPCTLRDFNLQDKKLNFLLVFGSKRRNSFKNFLLVHETVNFSLYEIKN